MTDVVYCLRMLRKSPGFAAVAILSLAFGIGINAAVFTVVKAALLEGFPRVYRNDRVVYITTTKDAVYYPDFEDWQSQAKSLDGVALVRNVFKTINDDGDAPDTYFTTEVTSNTFHLLGVEPFLGRDFSQGDEQPDAEPVVILRYDVWKRRFEGSTAIVGQTIRLDGVPTTVIGVMPQEFSFPTDQQLWVPLIPNAAARKRENFYARYAVARLGDGANIENARTELRNIGERLAREYPASNRGVVPVVRSFEEWFIGTNGTKLYKAMWVAVAFVLLIICANVANLLLERATGRTREISIRLALGAGHWRVVRQLFTETLLLSTVGGGLGWWIAKAVVRIYLMAQVNDVARILSYTMGYGVFAYLTVICLGTSLVVPFATAAHLTRLDINKTLKDGGRGISGGRYRRRLSEILVSAQIVLAVVLLASAGVIVRSFFNVYAADVGVNIANVLTMSLYIPPERYPNSQAQISFYENLRGRLEALPGVESLGFGTAAPTDYTPRVGYELADAPAADERSRPTVGEFVVSAEYFRTIGARLISGRKFGDSDRGSSTPVAIVNERFASRNWPREVPLGKRLRLIAFGKAATPWLTVVGVVSNIIQNDRTRQTFDSLVYIPYEQRPQANMFAFARTNVPPATLANAFRKQIYALDPYLPVPALMPLAERFGRSYAFERNMTAVFVVFAVVALLVAAIGLYAAISHSVSKRAQEIGIRVAIGATRSDILKLVLNQGIVPVGTGLVVGIIVSLAVNQVLKSQLVAVSPADPVALIAASAALVLAAALGCWIPARRATRVDPVVALRQE